MDVVLLRIKTVGMALILAAVASVSGYLIGQSINSDPGQSRGLSADLLTHKTDNSGKSCLPHGKYGQVKPPRASHCDNN